MPSQVTGLFAHAVENPGKGTVVSFTIEGRKTLSKRIEPVTFRLGEDSPLHYIFAPTRCKRELREEELPSSMTNREVRFLSELVKDKDLEDHIDLVTIKDGRTAELVLHPQVVPEDLELQVFGILSQVLRAENPELHRCSYPEELATV